MAAYFDWEPRVTYLDRRPTTLDGAAHAPIATPGAPPTMVTHKGRCHCGSVRFECDAEPAIIGWDCNCSICAMRRNVHFIVPVRRTKSKASRVGSVMVS